MKLLSRTIEYLKTAVIAVLFCSAVVLAGIYITRTLNMTLREDISLNEMVVTKNDGQGSISGFDSNYVLPEFIGYKNGNIKRGTHANEDLLLELFATVIPYVRNGLGSTYECNELSRTEGEKILSDILDSNFYVYAKFSRELPSVFLYSFCSGKTTVNVKDIANGPIVGIKDLFIKIVSLDGINYGYEILTVDSQKNYHMFTELNGEENTMFFDVKKINAYDVNTAMQDFKFYRELEEDELSHIEVDDLLLLTDGRENNQIINVNETKLNLSEDKYRTDKIVETIGINTDKSNIYDDSGDKVYVDSHGTVRISEDGTVFYRANEEKYAPSLSAFLNYDNYSGTYSIFEHILASQNFAEALMETEGFLFGGEAEMKFEGAYYESEILYVSFGYYFSNIPVYTEERENRALLLGLKNGRLISADIYPLNVSKAESLVGDYPVLWTLKRFDETLTENIHVTLVRAYREENGYGMPDTIFFKSGQGGDINGME